MSTLVEHGLEVGDQVSMCVKKKVVGMGPGGSIDVVGSLVYLGNASAFLVNWSYLQVETCTLGCGGPI